MRTFVALPIPDGNARALCDAAREGLRQSQADVKWVDSSHYHITLRFLGEIAEREAASVAAAVRDAAARSRPIEARFTTVGAFPSVRRPGTVWLGVEDAQGRLAALERALSAELERIDIPPEGRSFHPHVTLGRLRRDGRGAEALARRLERYAALPPGPQNGFTARRVTLFRSELTPDGPIYTALAQAELGEEAR